jgi:hypothetical protein
MTRAEMMKQHIDTAIKHLQESYMHYMASLKDVLDYGEANIAPLVSALNHKHANPIAKAIGLMTYTPAAEQAIPRLLDWLIIQSPMYPEVLEALVRFGDKTLPYIIPRIKECAEKNDDEAVRNRFNYPFTSTTYESTHSRDCCRCDLANRVALWFSRKSCIGGIGSA